VFDPNRAWAPVHLTQRYDGLIFVRTSTPTQLLEAANEAAE
jgi:hypothetical protein